MLLPGLCPGLCWPPANWEFLPRCHSTRRCPRSLCRPFRPAYRGAPQRDSVWPQNLPRPWASGGRSAVDRNRRADRGSHLVPRYLEPTGPAARRCRPCLAQTAAADRLGWALNRRADATLVQRLRDSVWPTDRAGIVSQRLSTSRNAASLVGRPRRHAAVPHSYRMRCHPPVRSVHHQRPYHCRHSHPHRLGVCWLPASVPGHH